jgi:hypothetical protein
MGSLNSAQACITNFTVHMPNPKHRDIEVLLADIGIVQ